jgi:LacI family transcriptional regulator
MTEKQVKAGKNLSGSQRFQCNNCRKKYTPAPKPNGYPDEIRKQVVLLALEGKSFRDIARKMGVNAQTVVNWINDYVAHSSRAIYKLPKK